VALMSHEFIYMFKMSQITSMEKNISLNTVCVFCTMWLWSCQILALLLTWSIVIFSFGVEVCIGFRGPIFKDIKRISFKLIRKIIEQFKLHTILS